MIIKNPNGQSYQMFPGTLQDPNNPANTIITSRQIAGNKIIFLSGALPTKKEALNATKATVEASPNILCETPEFDITYSYNVQTKKRYLRKSVIDALEMNYTAAGTIGYAAIILNNPDTANSNVIFTDSIGTWGQDTMPIILDNKIGAVGTRNLFKNISIELEDKPSQI